MNKKSIHRLVKDCLDDNSERDNVEFKDARGGVPGDLWKPISALSNTNGGIIVFGVKESSHPRRLEVVTNNDYATLQEKVVTLMEQKMKNHGPFDLKLIKYEGDTLLVLSVEETQKEFKPCYNTELGLPRGAYIRVGNVNQVISDEELKAFLRYSPEYKHDRTRAKGATIAMLDQEKIKLFLDNSAKRTGRVISQIDNEKVIKNVGIIDSYKGVTSPTLAGFLLFAREQPQDIQDFSRYVVRCVRYSGSTTSSEIIDQLDAYGTVDQQIDSVYKFITRNIAMRSIIVETKRHDKPEYPLDAIREIIANALIHRDYMITGTYVNISIFSDRIEISNPGNLPPGVTIDNLKDSQFSRNDSPRTKVRGFIYQSVAYFRYFL